MNRISDNDVFCVLAEYKDRISKLDKPDIFKSIEINQERFGYTNELKDILINTAKFLRINTYHRANES